MHLLGPDEVVTKQRDPVSIATDYPGRISLTEADESGYRFASPGMLPLTLRRVGFVQKLADSSPAAAMYQQCLEDRHSRRQAAPVHSVSSENLLQCSSNGVARASDQRGSIAGPCRADVAPEVAHR